MFYAKIKDKQIKTRNCSTQQILSQMIYIYIWNHKYIFVVKKKNQIKN